MGTPIGNSTGYLYSLGEQISRNVVGLLGPRSQMMMFMQAGTMVDIVGNFIIIVWFFLIILARLLDDKMGCFGMDDRV